MSTIKSFSVGNGDMFYVDHNSENFTIIDCCINSDTEDEILDEIVPLEKNKEITRFISTHPDEDHIRGLIKLDNRINILNFYCVENNATKADESDDFKHYRKLHNSDKSFYIYKGRSRKWMNIKDEERGSSGINILWPNIKNVHFQEALEKAKEGNTPNNISPIISYSLKNGIKALWMGDLESDFMDLIQNDLDLEKINVLFAPHHGRDSGKVPESMLQILDPEIIVIGEAPSEHLNYYKNYNTITQNSAGHIIFKCETNKVHIYTSKNYSVDFLADENKGLSNFYYLGTLNL